MGKGERIRAANGCRDIDRLRLGTLLLFLGFSMFTCFSNDSASSSSSLSSQNGNAEGAFDWIPDSFVFVFLPNLIR